MTVLRANAVTDALLGALLLGGTWDGLYEALDLPVPKPALYAQLAGALLLGWAWLLWTGGAPARVTAALNAFGAVLIVVWLAAGKVNADALGMTILSLVAFVLVVFAWLEARRV